MRTGVALFAVAVLGCSSRSRMSPGPDREWVTLEEYERRVPGKGPQPVVAVPAGAEVRLKFTRQPSATPFWTTRLAEDNPFETLELPALAFKARLPFFLDLERMAVSVDKERWWNLGQVLFSDSMAADISLAAGGRPPVTRPIDVFVFTNFGWSASLRALK